MNRIKTVALALALSLAAAPALAGTWTGVVTEIKNDDQGLTWFKLTGTPSTALNSCANHGGFAYNANATGGKVHDARVVLSNLTGKTITVTGNGMCSVLVGYESVGFVHLIPQ